MLSRRKALKEARGRNIFEELSEKGVVIMAKGQEDSGRGDARGPIRTHKTYAM